MLDEDLDYWIRHLFIEFNFRFYVQNTDESVSETVMSYEKFKDIILRAASLKKERLHYLPSHWYDELMSKRAFRRRQPS